MADNNTMLNNKFAKKVELKCSHQKNRINI